MIQTERLTIREYTINDAPFIYTLMNSEGWIKNIGDRNIKTIDDAAAYLQKNYISSYKKHGFGPYLVSLKDKNIPIGSAGLYKRDNLEYPDVGFAFLSEFGNKGYAFEASNAVMKFAFEELKLKKILGFTLPENKSSIKLLKKLGLLESGIYTYEDGEALLLFSNEKK
ncbi:GNAT family N-acetyltransferase [Aequorivita sp. Q41]|uniref:GNAT family N-acetyltransferase n=1 Tax=Aequorivita sp. Q41 TaxID=3153300 RepID=UPI003242D43E